MTNQNHIMKKDNRNYLLCRLNRNLKNLRMNKIGRLTIFSYNLMCHILNFMYVYFSWIFFSFFYQLFIYLWKWVDFNALNFYVFYIINYIYVVGIICFFEIFSDSKHTFQNHDLSATILSNTMQFFCHMHLFVWYIIHYHLQYFE